MDREDIIRMAREAGAAVSRHPEKWDVWEFQDTAVERFAHLVYESVFRDANIAASRTILDAAVLAEREACAKLAEETVCATHLPTGVNIYGSRAAKAIRERSNP
jgi:hypothetical protein